MSKKIEEIESQWEEGCESGNLDAGDLFGQLLDIANNLDYKLRISKNALIDISEWSDSLEEIWDDPGHRAKDVLRKIK